MRTITLDQLLKAGACEEQVKLFKKHFKKSVVVTEELATSLADIFDFGWASRNLLTIDVLADYGEACAPAWTKCDKLCAAAYIAYNKTFRAAQIELTKVRNVAADGSKELYTAAESRCYEAYQAALITEEKIYMPARAERDKVCAVMFARMYNK